MKINFFVFAFKNAYKNVMCVIVGLRIIVKNVYKLKLIFKLSAERAFWKVSIIENLRF